MRAFPIGPPSQEAGQFVVYHVHGHLDLDTQDDFERAVHSRLDDTSVVVDLSGVDFLAISSLRSLVRCHHTAVALHRALVYAEAQSQARRLLNLAGLDTYLDLRDALPTSPAA